MKMEKHFDVLKEVEDEIDSSIKDPVGLIKHQRRLAFMISLGIVELVEIYFHKLGILKEGSRIKHEWFKKAKIKEFLSKQITAPIEKVNKIDHILSISKNIEERRNDLAYSSPLDRDEILRDEINSYFEIKKIVERESGGVF